MIKTVLASALCLASSVAAAEVRCGWLDNPSPANLFLNEPHGSWIVSAQGSHQPPGLELLVIRDPNHRVSTSPSGSYGYSCFCMDALFDPSSKKVLQVRSAQQQLLKTCLEMPGLAPMPKY